MFLVFVTNFSICPPSHEFYRFHSWDNIFVAQLNCAVGPKKGAGFYCCCRRVTSFAKGAVPITGYDRSERAGKC